MNHWVMDWETLVDSSLVVFEHYKTDETKVFAMCRFKNDIQALIDFLTQNKNNNEWHIGFNNLTFDSQITQYLMINQESFLKMSGINIAKALYKKAQECITRQNLRQFPEWNERNFFIKQIDLFKLNHWDNPAKMSSLKSIQVAMKWHNVQDMPIHHTTSITCFEQLKTIAGYCRNDVSSTKHIMKLCSKLINLRGTLSTTYNINLYSASEPRIAKELFLHFLAKRSGISKYELKSLRTYRSEIKVKNIILPYINFSDDSVFLNLLREYQNLVIYPGQTKGGFKHSIDYKGMQTDFGLGGVHGARKGIYESGNGMIIMTSDVVSYYPNLAIRNKWAPGHLPKKIFCDLYEWFFDERVKIPKKDPRNYVYKIILNSTFGLTIDENSFLYDPLMGMQITINGQLSLMMLYVMLAENIPNCTPLMQNTDGLEMMIPEEYYEKYLQICEQWEEITQLKLEHGQYSKLIIPDVNNYIAINKFKEVTKEDYFEMLSENPQDLFKIENNKYYYAGTKCKGRFEFKDLALHKNNSFLIITKALFYFFVHDIPPEKYIIENRDIFDYCGSIKIKGDWQFIQTSVLKEHTVDLSIDENIKIELIRKHNFVEAYEKGRWIKPHHDIYKARGWTTDYVYTKIMEGTIEQKVLQKTNRYYISKTGYKIIKKNINDGREINVVSGRWMQTVYNKHVEKPFSEYNIDDAFYLDRIYKEIKSMVPEQFDHQLSLFNN